MLRSNQLVGFGGANAAVNAVKYNGSTDYLSKAAGLTGLTTMTSGILSVWLRRDADTANHRVINSNSCTMLSWSAANQAYFSFSNGTGSRYDIATSAVLAGGTWHHVLCAFKTSPARSHSIYLDDVLDDTLQGGYPDDGLTFTIPSSTSWDIGALAGPSDFLNGAIAEMYFYGNQFLDFSVAANRRLFRTAGGKPANLGPTGASPLGSQPHLYLRNPAASVGNNSGSGGNFTINGAPSIASSHP